MSERSIAEIIGTIDGQETPDDMLAFLVERDEHDGIETWSDRGGHVVKLWISTQSWAEEYHGGTLRGALEAAVRSLAGDR